ncbi:hypothetical protein CMI37_04105 [Candidatus Pacearchaeota archaeon]|jgi:hypothetical protein|nr:hypothetical protein [Candidatus Pacearchaeota archaeon]|tara:strand:+ start:455 stop:685 length:231 start_codon:yes stop_codon:yes gene_type:complete
MGVIRDSALESVNKIKAIRASEFLFSTEGRKLVADALVWYQKQHLLEDSRDEQISELLDNIFDVWHERRFKLDEYR